MPSRIPGLALALSIGLALMPVSLENADANGDTRSISIMNVHTNESATVTFKRNGYYDAEGIKQLSWLLRDWRRDEPTSMSPRLFDILWEVHQESGSQEPFHAVSGYRSPATNAMLRRSSRGVAEHSQHMLGRAMDSFLPDVPISRMREIAMHMQRGGVGYYPTAGSPFVHIDAGGVRAWPRMTRDQLARLFPDGKTVHLPPDGHPLPGYEQAKAEILAAGGTVAGITAYAEAEPQEMGSGHHKSLWAALFGGADEDEDGVMANAGRGVTSRSVASRQPTQVAALASTRDDDGVHALLAAQDQGQSNVASAPAPSANTSRTRRGTTSPTVPAPAADAGTTVALRSVAPAQTPADAGTTVALRSAAPAQTLAAAGTTVAMRSDAKIQDDAGPTAGSPLMMAFAPLPPHRPKTLAEVAALADTPLPPIRPTSLDAALPEAASDVPAATSADHADAGKLVALDHPLPPSRTQVLALADPAPAVSASDFAPADGTRTDSAGVSPSVAAPNQAPSEKPDAAGQLVRVDHPLPPSRPVQFAAASGQTARASQGTGSGATAATLGGGDKESLKALFETAALVPARLHTSASPPIKVANAVVQAALPKVAQDVIAQPASAAGHFQASSTPPVVNRFSGKAIEPLNAFGFTTRQ